MVHNLYFLLFSVFSQELIPPIFWNSDQFIVCTLLYYIAIRPVKLFCIPTIAPSSSLSCDRQIIMFLTNYLNAAANDANVFVSYIYVCTIYMHIMIIHTIKIVCTNSY